VMDAAGSNRAALLGILEGAAISALFAAAYPERTSALVLLLAFPRVRWAPDYPWGVTNENWRAFEERVMTYFVGSREAAVATARVMRGSEPPDEEVLADLDYLRRAAATPSTLQAY